MGLRVYDQSQQLKLVDESVNDERPASSTGVMGVDLLLRRGGILPGNFALLGGRTGTRKTTTMLNMAVTMAEAGTPVAIVGLDEAPWQYVVKMMSVRTGRSPDQLEEELRGERGDQLRQSWREFARGKVHVLAGTRPHPEHLDATLRRSALRAEEQPRVVFIDYLSLLTRAGEFGFNEQSRIPRLAEALQVWSNAAGVGVVALHQLSRNDEFGGTNSRNAGHIPVTLAQLKYGGEEQADIVFSTYRPALNPVGNMTFEMAKQTLGDRFDEDEYWELRALVKRYEGSTFLQLLKNRPSTRGTEERGVELLSVGDSILMMEKEAAPDQEEENERVVRATQT